MTTEASDTKELAFKDLRPGQAIYLRTTKDVAKLFSTNDTIQGFQILMVTNEDLKMRRGKVKLDNFTSPA